VAAKDPLVGDAPRSPAFGRVLHTSHCGGGDEQAGARYSGRPWDLGRSVERKRRSREREERCCSAN
jgi:hypothetical protein